MLVVDNCGDDESERKEGLYKRTGWKCPVEMLGLTNSWIELMFVKILTMRVSGCCVMLRNKIIINKGIKRLQIMGLCDILTI